MKTNPFMLTLVLAVAVSLLSCSGGLGDKSPIAPTTNNIAGHSLMGSYKVRFDLASESVEIISFRITGNHYNVTNFLKPPTCSDCFQIHVQGIDWINHELTADVTVKNFTNALTGYDVRGIVYPLGDYVLKNPDAYTLLYAPLPVDTPAGFRAYEKIDPDRALGPHESSTETYVIGFPEGAGFIDLVYAVDASWPDHCPEPYDIYGFEQAHLGFEPGSTALVTVYVSDWQENTTKVTINTDLLGGSEYDLSHVSGEVWTGTVTNLYGMPPGTYPVMITGRDSETLNHLFQWFDLVVSPDTDIEPPIWDSDEGITSIAAGLGGVLVRFGTASDPSVPVTYNLYWSLTSPIDFDAANVVAGITGSPYLLEGLSPAEYFFCVRAQDEPGNETANTAETSAIVGEHPNVWWQDGPPLSSPRGYAGGLVSDGKFWVLGGSSAGTPFDTVEVYDPSLGSWSSPFSLPEPRDAFVCQEIDGSAYILGGRYSETATTDDCIAVSLLDGSVDDTLPKLPSELANAGSAKIDITIYLTGGREFTGTEWVSHRQSYSFTPGDVDFTGETDMEFDLYSFGMAAGPDYVILCGGYPDHAETMLYYPGVKSWIYKSAMEFATGGNVSVMVNGWFYSMGGEAGWMQMNNVDVYNLDQDMWYSIEPLNNPRFSAAVGTDGTYIYITGGFKNVGPATVPIASFEIGRIF